MDNQFLALIVQYVHIHIKQIFNIFSGKDVVRRAGHGYLSVFHGDDVVCVGGGLVDVVQDDDGGALVFAGQPLEQLHERAGVVHIEIVERFVQEDVIGALAEDHGNHGALALSAGEFGQVAVGEAVQFELGKCVFDDSEVQLADKGVGHQLECQRGELLVVVGLAGDAVVLVVLALK